MPNLLDPSDRTAILERIHRLTPGHARRWGTMDAHRMICHVADQLRVALGETPLTWRYPAPVRPVLRFVVIHLPLPAPKGKVPTVPEMLVSKPAGWDEDLRGLIDRVERLAATEVVHPHPAFGRLTRREWGLLSWKHLDHHLRQFGE